MLDLVVPGAEVYDDEANEFNTVGDVVLQLEHSLLSMSKWESKFQKPFLSDEKKTVEETVYYIRAMIISPIYPSDIVQRLTEDNMQEINGYIESPQTATTFHDYGNKQVGGRSIITSELVYYWMVTYNIPFETETWHLNRLLTLIRICNAKNSKPKQMSRAEAARQRADLNAQRRAMLNTTG